MRAVAWLLALSVAVRALSEVRGRVGKEHDGHVATHRRLGDPFCREGQYVTFPDGVGKPYCTWCPDGETSSDGNLECETCPVGTYSNASTYTYGDDSTRRRLETDDDSPSYDNDDNVVLRCTRERQHQPAGCTPSCPADMKDTTNGNALYWGCGSGCAGGHPTGSGGFVTLSCTCACQCKSGVPKTLKNKGAEGNVCATGRECKSCPAGQIPNAGQTGCVDCAPGKISSAGDASCEECDAGKHSNTERTECLECAAGSVSGAGQASCDTCGVGLFSSVGQGSPCKKCGDDPSIWDQSWWDPNLTGMTSADQCACQSHRTGANCEIEVCAPTTPVVSLGFLLLDVQWPQYARSLSKNEAFSGISGAFRAYDTNGDNFLSVTEARTGIAAGGMAVPLELSHVWSRVENGARVEISGVASLCAENGVCFVEGQYCPTNGYCCVGSKWVAASTCRGDVTITTMIQDELDQLEVQKTVSYYDHPSGSGNIASITATYPHSGPGWNNNVCEDDKTKSPVVEWTVDREGKFIFQQCVFYNGVALNSADGLKDEVSSGKSNVNSADCSAEGDADTCEYKFHFPEGYEVKSYHQSDGTVATMTQAPTVTDAPTLVDADAPTANPTLTDAPTLTGAPTIYPADNVEILKISKQSYCVKTKFCTTRSCTKTTVDPALTVTRCITGLQYDGTPADIFPRMKGTLGVSISWLYTSPEYTVYRVYKVANANTPFVDDTSARLLHEVELKTATCGLTFAPLNFRDTTTGSQPAVEAAYAVVPLATTGDELKTMAGVSGFIVTWWGDVHVSVAAYGGGAVQGVTVKLSHLVDNNLDPDYTDFMEGTTNEYGHVTLPVRVQDRAWADITQYFRINVFKSSKTAKGREISHKFAPSSSNPSLRHLHEVSITFTDQTAVVISGTVSHDGFGAAYFDSDCPYKKTKFDGFPECICSVDGAKLEIKRASGSVENVDLQEDGFFSHSVSHGEKVKLSLTYSGTNGKVPHSFTVSHDAGGDDATVQEGTAPTFSYKASEDATVDFVDTSTQNLTAALVAGADAVPTEYVNGLPIVASVARCGWEMPAWTLRGVVEFRELGAAAVELRTLGPDDVENAKYYYPAGVSGEPAVEPCSSTSRSKMVSADEQMRRGCRVEIPKVEECSTSSNVEVPGCQTTRRPCATMDKTYVDELPQIRKFAVDLSRLGSIATDAESTGRRLGATPDATPLRLGRHLLAETVTAPTAAPTGVPTRAPTTGPTAEPTAGPTAGPTPAPSAPAPSSSPTVGPTTAPTHGPTPAPSAAPTVRPTPAPSTTPTAAPTTVPTSAPTIYVPPVPDVEFVVTSPLCLASVSVKGTKLQKLISPPKGGGSREFNLATDEDLLLAPPSGDDYTPPEGEDLYGEACTDDTNAVFREGDAVDLGFELVGREPQCYKVGIWPWDWKVSCGAYKDASPSPSQPIEIEIIDGVSGTQSSATYGDETYDYTMHANSVNPFAPFSNKLSLVFSRAFDGARIQFARYVLVLGSIPEDVPQVWTTAVEGLIFSIIRDPPGGASTATLVEGSTISTAMAIEGAHAATLAEANNLGGSGGIQGGIKLEVAPMGFGTLMNGIGFGVDMGGSNSRSTSVTVNRGSSQHFDVSISFDVAISTSSSPYLAGQPSDVIIGGGANLRFISAIEVYATDTGTSSTPRLCLHGRETQHFLPEQVTTYAISVYEIEKTIERLGEELRNLATGATVIKPGGVSVTPADLQKHLETWRTVLANYRATTVRTDLSSVAAQLDGVLDTLKADFTALGNDLTDAEDSELTEFVNDGIDALTENSQSEKNVTKSVPAPGNLNDGGTSDKAKKWKSTGTTIEDLVGKASDSLGDAATKCIAASRRQLLPSESHALCAGYSDLAKKLSLVTTLLGVCKFAKDGCCDPRDATKPCTDDNKCSSVDVFCKKGKVPGIGSSSHDTAMSAFDFLTDTGHTTKFLTFSGSTGVDFQWDVAEALGFDSTVETQGSVDVVSTYDGSFGFEIGRRLTDALPSSSSHVTLAGYAYPAGGAVHAVSKKLLEVTPEALVDKRRRLEDSAEKFLDQAHRKLPGRLNVDAVNDAAEKINSANPKTVGLGNPCRRRRLQLGIQGCIAWGSEQSNSFAVSMSRSASNTTQQHHSVIVSMKDPNLKDSFVVRVAQDPVYGTPVFTTMGGRSSCVGETATTKRDSSVTIKEIKPFCNDCAGKSECKCLDLAPGQDAYFSVMLENRSPWSSPVQYLLRASNGASSGENTKTVCVPGDPGSLQIFALGLVGGTSDVRNNNGVTIRSLPYGQSEVRISVSRKNFAPQCFSYSKIQLELVSVCENVNFDSNQEVYQYNTTMNLKNGHVSVVHPRWVGRPVVGECDVATKLDFPDGSVAKNQGTGRWCYSDLNMAVGCTESPKTCWEACDKRVAELKALNGGSYSYSYAASHDYSYSYSDGKEANVRKDCPASLIKYVGATPTCDVGDLKAIDWDEKTGQCRCQNSCDCLVDDLVSQDTNKPVAISYLLTANDVKLPTDKCDAYSFEKDTTALGSATSKASFDVSWAQSTAPPTASCTYAAAAELLFAKDGASSGGCMYKTASNYDSTATFDDGSCAFTTLKGCPDHLYGISAGDCPASAESLPRCNSGGLRAGEFCLEDGTCSDGKGTECAVVTSVRRHLRRLQSNLNVMLIGTIDPLPAPTSAPTGKPSAAPTGSPAPSVSAVPTSSPTQDPTQAPTGTFAPTRSETYAPTTDTYAPTSTPTSP